jgi:hypothetical protein
MGFSDAPSFSRFSLATQARLGAASVSDPLILEASSLHWEEDFPASPCSRDREASSFGVANLVVGPVSEVSLAKAVRSPPQAKPARNPSLAMGLIRHGFFGPQPSPNKAIENHALVIGLGSNSLLVVKRVTPHSDGVFELGRSLCQFPIPTSSVSKS